MIKVGINGFGRIGKCLLRAIFENNLQNEIIVSQINSVSLIESDALLFEYDSIYGKFQKNISIDGKYLIVDGHKILMTSEKNLNNLKWDDLDLVFECTGAFQTEEDLSIHLKNGAKKVLLSSPPKDEKIKTILYKVNQELYSNEKIISIGSCTTNCLAPIIKILKENFTIKSGFITTVHAYTNDQRVLDCAHLDLRRSRAAALSMIPTTTGVTKAIKAVFPDLGNAFSGSAIRVPVESVSLIDASILIKEDTNKNDLMDFFKKNINEKMNDILGIESKPLVSRDYIKDKRSSIIDEQECFVVNRNLIRILSWYDNEFSFVNRMIDLGKFICK
jgi:glyceraldehyde 3-phosphate dehydrogenase